MANCEAKIRASDQHIKNILKRNAELTKQIDFVRKNTNKLLQERNRFLSGGSNDSHSLSSVLYTNTIQQSITLENTYGRQIDNYFTRKEEEKIELKELNRQLDQLREEIKRLEFNKDNVQSIEILKPPSRSAYPIKPKIKLNVMIAGIVGLFVMLFLAFFLEYIQRHRDKLGQ